MQTHQDVSPAYAQEKPARRNLIHVPTKPSASLAKRAVRAGFGTLMSPFYCSLASRAGTPGMKFHGFARELAWRVLRDRTRHISLAYLWRLALFPMDSFRYFEFDFAGKALSGFERGRYLDVSSPRLFPVHLIARNPAVHADLINPDEEDLHTTENMLRALSLEQACTLHQTEIGRVQFCPDTFDAVTSISVVEHIPDDQGAVRTMWQILKPGGRLVLTVPCAKERLEEFVDFDEYGLLQPDADGYFFFQRFYDMDLLQQNIFTITGNPVSCSIYGEREAGSYFRNQRSRLVDPAYPMWREPYMMAEEYRYFDSVDSLPGVGVIALEFVKN
jgi:SAM-dependent methyltransferase